MKVINLKIVQDGVIAIYNVNLIDTKSAYRIEVKFNQCLLISIFFSSKVEGSARRNECIYTL